MEIVQKEIKFKPCVQVKLQQNIFQTIEVSVVSENARNPRGIDNRAIRIKQAKASDCDIPKERVLF